MNATTATRRSMPSASRPAPRSLTSLVGLVVGLMLTPLLAMLAIVASAPAANAAFGDAITCLRMYAIRSETPGGVVQIYEFNPNGTATLNTTTTQPTNGVQVNGLGTIPSTNEFVYLERRSIFDTGGPFTETAIYRTNATTGATTRFLTGPLEDLNTTPGIVMGAVNPVNNLYYFAYKTQRNFGAPIGATPFIVKAFDLNTNTMVPGIIGYIPTAVVGGTGNGDFVFDGAGRLYIASDGHLVRTNSTPSTATNAALSTTQIAVLSQAGGTIYSAAVGPFGYLYVGGRANLDGTGASTIRQIDPSTGNEVGANSTSAVLPNGFADFASCALPYTVQLRKDLPDGRAVSTDQFALNLSGGGITQGPGSNGTTQGTESGVQNQDDAEIAGPVMVIPGDTVNLAEAAANGADLADYVSSWRCDFANGQTLSSGTGTSGSISIPNNGPAGVLGADLTCTITNRKLADVEVAKSADPADGSTVVPGQTVDYTVTFTNPSTQVPATVDYDDILTDVLDDASITTQPSVTNPNGATAPLSISNLPVDQNTDRIEVDGTLSPGEVVTLTYSVTVKPDGQRGNDALDNFVVPGGGTTNGVCAAGDPLCTHHPVPDLVVEKTSNPADGAVVAPGQDVVYTLSFTNDGQAPATVDYTDDLADVLDDADVQVQPTATNGLSATNVTNNQIRVTGTVQPGQTATVVYTMRVKPDGQRGDDELDNFLVRTGDTHGGTCLAGDPLCVHHPVPELQVEKTSSPVDGSVVAAGGFINYTLTFTNTGAADAQIDWTDDVADVLDDADVTIQPNAAAPLTASAIAGGEFTIGGTLNPGQSRTVTYQVQVKPDGQRGDSVLDNFVFRTGDTHGPDCLVGDPLCTRHTSPDIEVAKSAVPADGSTVEAGDTIDYTISFTNNGGAAVAVDYTDDLADVLDDADVTTQPSTQAPLTAGAIANQAFQVTGILQPGQTRTVTYTVTVRPDDQRGNNSADNFVVKTGDTHGPCVAGDPLCTHHPMPLLEVEKSANPIDGSAVEAGDTIDYTITFTNSGQAPAVVDHTDDLADVLDDAAVTQQPVAAAPLNATNVANQAFRVTGTLQPGQTRTVTYQVTVRPDDQRGDNRADNFVVETGDTHGPCVAGDPLCTTHVMPELQVEKTADPVDGSAVEAGDTVDYTISFTNNGQAPATVDHTDDLADVLDDATISQQPSVTPANALTVSPVANQQFQVAGTVAPGATVTVTYQVTIRPDDQRGNNRADNFVVKTGDTHGPCVAGDPLCTHHPIPLLQVEKSANPADGSDVAPGQTIDYTLTFTNTGQAPIAVDHTDDLADVLDDADVTVQPVAAAPLSATNVTNDEFVVTGTLQPGQSRTVTYQVTIKPDGQRGNNRADNFVVETGDTHGPCVAGDPLCTTHLVPELEVEKSSNPVDGSTVADGDTIDYTITFTNSGQAPAAVDYTDDLADVLDDAVVTQQPSAQAPLSATAVSNDAFRVTGTLPAGATRTVTYQVTVQGDRGDKQLDNFVVKTGDTHGPCVAGDPLCTTHLVPDLVVEKTADPADGTAVDPGDEIDYAITFTNNGAGAAPVDYTDELADVLDDADVTVQPSANPAVPLTVSAIANQEFRVTGTLASGDSVTVTYTVTIRPDGQRGNNRADNFVVETGDTHGPCVAGDPLCTSHPVPQLQVEKTANPTDGTAVEAGDTIDYTISLTNTGQAAAPVDYTDDLADVLDDATISQQPSTNPANALTVSPVANQQFQVTGSVAAGATVTVTYQVTIRPDDQRGNNAADNFVVHTGDTHGPCVAGDPLCTHHPIPLLEVAKDSNPADGSTVAAGEVITYTLTFTNSGQAPAAVDHTDDLADVLDDASVTQPPVAQGPLTASNVANQEFQVTGTLQPGTTRTVTYQVTVGPDGQRGDDRLDNYVVKTGDTHGPCAAGDPLCTTHLVPELEVEKTAVPVDGSTVEAGDTIDYTLTFTNDGAAPAVVDYTDDLADVLDDADVTTQPSAQAPLTVGTITNQQFQVTGTLQPGQTRTVTYTVTVKPDDQRGNNAADNFVVKTGDTHGPCVAGDPLCTHHPMPQLEVEKSANPADGTAVEAGQVLTYTLTFTNSGQAPATVDYTDDLADVLDDAAVTQQPVAAAPLNASNVANQEFQVTGTLQPGTSRTVTYQVTVRPDGQRGNDRLDNFVVKTGDTHGPCATGDPLCTSHPVPELEVEKTADPADGSAVEAGDEIDYSITFTNTGQAPAAVDYTDDLADVLDDADVTVQPSASPGNVLTVGPIANQQFAVTGQLPAGATVTVTYTVTVKDDGDRGNNAADNFVVKTGDTHGPCVAGDPLCTHHPMPLLEVEKDANPADGSRVVAGEVLTYTLTFTNSGQAPAAVDYTDDLADVLDDAAVTQQPVAVAPLNATNVANQEFRVTGTLQPGTQRTVTYQVTVRPDGQRGDNVLDNFVVKTGDPHTPDCLPADPLCTHHPVPELEVEKDANPADGSTVEAGDVITYTLTFDNVGQADAVVDYTDLLADVLDDADVTTQPVATNPLVVSAIANQQFAVTGTLPAGQSATVTYAVTVKPDGQRGDNAADNFVVKTGDTPDPDCVVGDPLCTHHPMPELEVEKTSNPADGSTVEAGRVLTYTLTFSNSGQAAAAIDYTDLLADVLDDADVTSQPDAQAPLSATTVTGGQFQVTGSLQPGQTRTVTYQVTVKPDGDRGDDVLDNFVVETGETPPPDCVVSDPLCTHHPVPEIGVVKDVDPTDGSVVEAGQVLTYTLTFTNTGAAPGKVDYTDLLSGVLDDAAVVSQPAVTPAGALTATQVNHEKFRVTGTLAPGAKVEVTYKVKVRPDGKRGDDYLVNFVIETGDTPPAGCKATAEKGCQPSECEVGDPLCTENPVPELIMSKDVDPADGSRVKAGDVLTYTLHFRNTGAAAIKVDAVDDISDVLDNADFVKGSIKSPVLKVTGPNGAGDLHITGNLGAKKSTTVVYQVKVKQNQNGKNKKLDNFLMENGEDTPDTCPAGDPLCTHHDLVEVGHNQWLPSTGGPAFWVLLLGLLLSLTGVGFLFRRMRHS